MKSKVFLSYASPDEPFVHMIRGALSRANVSTIVDPLCLSAGDSIIESISKAIAACDFMIILVSPDALKSEWMMRELETLTSREWQQRAITVIPVKIRPCVVPQYLSRWHALDLTRSLPRGLDRLVGMVRLAPTIELARLDGITFERLVYDLLKAYGFRKIRQGDSWQDRGFDFIAEYTGKDPFGRDVPEQWIIEAKASRNQTDIQALKQFMASFSYRQERYTALFITASQLTSASREWISSLQKQGAPRFMVLEGTDIVRLLLSKPKVAEKFFAVEGN